MIYQTTLNMKKIIITLLSITMLLNATNAFAWGAKGHDIVAAIAEQHLTRKAKKNISRLLDGKSIVYYSSWMDNIQNSPYWENGYNQTKTWHYANVDKGMTYQTMPKNPSGDVITGLEFLTRELTENYDNLTDSMRVDYLKMIDSARKWSYSEWVEHLDRTSRKYKKRIMRGTYEEWFMDTVDGAASLYEYVENMGVDNPNLSYQYVYDFSPLLEDRLLVAGYRLAYVLNTIFG